jgi:hypothetical protein
MVVGKCKSHDQQTLFIPTANLPQSAARPFYAKLDEVLAGRLFRHLIFDPLSISRVPIGGFIAMRWVNVERRKGLHRQLFCRPGLGSPFSNFFDALIVAFLVVSDFQSTRTAARGQDCHHKAQDRRGKTWAHLNIPLSFEERQPPGAPHHGGHSAACHAARETDARTTGNILPRRGLGWFNDDCDSHSLHSVLELPRPALQTAPWDGMLQPHFKRVY